MKPKILIIDDDEELNRLLTSYLGQFEFEVITATHPSAGLKLLETVQASLVVLDIMLPHMSGLEVCREIRRSSGIPIIMLTARGELTDRIVGLELGADDYLPKPYEPRELVARIQSVLRRTQGQMKPSNSSSSEPARPTVSRSGDLVVDFVKASATLSGISLDLTTAEFTVLQLLMDNAGKTLTRDEILTSVRGGGNIDSLDRTVDMVISRLRHKLGDDTKNSRFLKTMWGEGYRFIGEVSNE